MLTRRGNEMGEERGLAIVVGAPRTATGGDSATSAWLSTACPAEPAALPRPGSLVYRNDAPLISPSRIVLSVSIWNKKPMPALVFASTVPLAETVLAAGQIRSFFKFFKDWL